jgi:hypothetical protein
LRRWISRKRGSSARKKKDGERDAKILGSFNGDSFYAAPDADERTLQSRSGGGRPHGDNFARVLFKSIAAGPHRSVHGFQRPAGAHPPSAPAKPVIHMPEADHPQPRRRNGSGMAVFVDEFVPPAFGWKFVALGHNTIRGAAGAAVLNAELMYTEGLLD